MESPARAMTKADYRSIGDAVLFANLKTLAVVVFVVALGSVAYAIYSGNARKAVSDQESVARANEMLDKYTSGH